MLLLLLLVMVVGLTGLRCVEQGKVGRSGKRRRTGQPGVASYSNDGAVAADAKPKPAHGSGVSVDPASACAILQGMQQVRRAVVCLATGVVLMHCLCVDWRLQLLVKCGALLPLALRRAIDVSLVRAVQHLHNPQCVHAGAMAARAVVDGSNPALDAAPRASRATSTVPLASVMRQSAVGSTCGGKRTRAWLPLTFVSADVRRVGFVWRRGGRCRADSHAYIVAHAAPQELYQALLCAVVTPEASGGFSSCLTPALRLFRAGASDGSPCVAAACAVASNVCESMLHPRAPCLFVPAVGKRSAGDAGLDTDMLTGSATARGNDASSSDDDDDEVDAADGAAHDEGDAAGSGATVPPQAAAQEQPTAVASSEAGDAGAGAGARDDAAGGNGTVPGDEADNDASQAAAATDDVAMDAVAEAGSPDASAGAESGDEAAEDGNDDDGASQGGDSVPDDVPEAAAMEEDDAAGASDSDGGFPDLVDADPDDEDLDDE